MAGMAIASNSATGMAKKRESHSIAVVKGNRISEVRTLVTGQNMINELGSSNDDMTLALTLLSYYRRP